MTENSTQQNPGPEPDYTYVRNQAGLDKLSRRIDAAARVAVDTEADSLHNYFEKVCLIQLSIGGGHYVVDPLAGVELSGFLASLAAKPLIFHAGDYDLRILRASTGFRPGGEIFDTMIAAQLLGIEQIGLAALLERVFAITIGKEGQKSDWSQRPLSEKQLHYAVNDTRYLEALADRLAEELGAKGRLEWHRASCRAMVQASGRDNPRDPDDAWRLKGAGRLTRRQLAYLREVWRWRDDHARRFNRPPFKIFGNQQIFELIQWAESHPNEPLDKGPKLPRNIKGVLLTTLVESLARAAALPAADWPETKKHERGEAPSPESVARADTLRSACADIAKALEISPSVLAPRAALEAIARSQARGVDAIMERGGLLRWQAELIQGVVEKCVG
ncbi:MAG TPA: HRDC domain-containing protein [Candidatus Binatia bacterium]